MKDGIYQYEQINNPYDTGVCIVDVRDTEKYLTLRVLEKNMQFSSHMDTLFKDDCSVRINKQKSPHTVHYGEDYFVVYPNRAGCPLCFKRR